MTRVLLACLLLAGCYTPDPPSVCVKSHEEVGWYTVSNWFGTRHGRVRIVIRVCDEERPLG